MQGRDLQEGAQVGESGVDMLRQVYTASAPYVSVLVINLTPRFLEDRPQLQLEVKCLQIWIRVRVFSQLHPVMD